MLGYSLIRRSHAPAGALVLAAAMLLHAGSAGAATCTTLSGNSSTTQTVSNGTCTVDPGVALDIASGSTAASPTTLINSGTIEITGSGSGRAVQSNGSAARRRAAV
jgi:hypothetical protein